MADKELSFDTEVYADYIGDDRKVEVEITRLSKQAATIKDQKKESMKTFNESLKEVNERIEYLLSVHGMKKADAAEAKKNKAA